MSIVLAMSSTLSARRAPAPSIAAAGTIFFLASALPMRQTGPDESSHPESEGAPALPVTIHGIPSCDTVRKARTWLDGHGIAYRFHDFRADGLDEARLEFWL